MCDIDLEPCSVFEETLVKKARKEHCCDMCGGTIAVGASYMKHFSIFDGAVTNEKMCIPCRDVAEEFLDHHGQRSNPSCMADLLTECVNEESTFTPDDKVELTEMGKKWQAHIDAMEARYEARKWQEHIEARKAARSS